jgi:hypothetical protein
MGGHEVGYEGHYRYPLIVLSHYFSKEEAGQDD